MALLELRDSEASLTGAEGRAAFAARLREVGRWPLRRGRVETLQINVGKRCNQACHHCHVEAGPARTEVMAPATAERLMALLAPSPETRVVDITGGAPELNPSFRYLVATSRALGRHVLVRHNLTVQQEPGQEGLVAFFAEHGVEVVASLPCYTEANVDEQRGSGVFARSIAALRALNAAGFGVAGGERVLTLVYNPGGAFLPGPEAALEADYRARLGADFGVSFTRLQTITNMPIKRFAHDLRRRGALAGYQALLEERFNAATVPHVMCTSLVSVGWDGALYDCDFNQMLALGAGAAAANTAPRTIFAVAHLAELAGAEVAVGRHCFGCTAGAGSSCGGALA
ncbi:MAG: arsenosugar biosynthesis radical SAM protein ArsS [Deltaproteobacteria bacterium]|nr:arsenosugar biosynthesis radical SAM protein ArsS [Deltaproteobacteria bacterium]